MTDAEMIRKLAQIKRMSCAELEGYEAEARARGFFPGEHAAILQRRAAV